MPVEQPAAAEFDRALREIAQLKAALGSRTVIGQASGILMERYEVDETAALAILRRASNSLNIRVHDVAVSLVSTRQLPRELLGDAE